jgi:hypothetical protein
MLLPKVGSQESKCSRNENQGRTKLLHIGKNRKAKENDGGCHVTDLEASNYK